MPLTLSQCSPARSIPQKARQFARKECRRIAEILRYNEATIENTPNLRLIQAEVTSLVTETDGNGKTRVIGVNTEPCGEFECKAVVISTGTYLGGATYVGDVKRRSGPDNSLPAEGLNDSLREPRL